MNATEAIRVDARSHGHAESLSLTPRKRGRGREREGGRKRERESDGTATRPAGLLAEGAMTGNDYDPLHARDNGAKPLHGSGPGLLPVNCDKALKLLFTTNCM